MIRVQRSHDAREFLTGAGAFLGEREAEHNLLLGICSLLLSEATLDANGPAYFAIAKLDGRIVGVAMQTPPRNLILSEIDDLGAIEPLARDARDSIGSLPGVVGPIDATSAFVGAWRHLQGGSATLTMTNRIYRASVATPPSGIAGEMRSYGDGDRDLTTRWLEAFLREALPHEATSETAETLLERRLADAAGGVRLWEHEGRAVSFAGFGSRTPNGIRVGPVYTPPEFRRKGYAGALVGRMTAELLDGRHRFCFLFTDLANPTSNGVYQRIGYEAVTDVDQYAFV